MRSRLDVGTLQDAKEVHTVKDKILIKAYLSHHGVATPETIAVFTPGTTIPDDFLNGIPTKFVIKPNNGAQGHDILILTRLNGELLEPDGHVRDKDEVLAHMRKLLASMSSVMVEKTIEPHPKLAELSPYGTMPDLRFHFAGNNLLFALLRKPTKRSRGLGNVFRGAMRLVADANGIIFKSPHWLPESMVNPDTGENFEGKKVPMWEEMLDQVKRVPPLFNSRLVCVDGVLDVNGRFVVPEVTLMPSLWTFTGWDYMYDELTRSPKPRVDIPIYRFKQ